MQQCKSIRILAAIEEVMISSSSSVTACNLNTFVVAAHSLTPALSHSYTFVVAAHPLLLSFTTTTAASFKSSTMDCTLNCTASRQGILIKYILSHKPSSALQTKLHCKSSRHTHQSLIFTPIITCTPTPA